MNFPISAIGKICKFAVKQSPPYKSQNEKFDAFPKILLYFCLIQINIFKINSILNLRHLSTKLTKLIKRL